MEHYSYDPTIGRYIYIQASGNGQGQLIGDCVVGIVGGAIMTYISGGFADIFYGGAASAWIEASCGISIEQSWVTNW